MMPCLETQSHGARSSTSGGVLSDGHRVLSVATGLRPLSIRLRALDLDSQTARKGNAVFCQFGTVGAWQEAAASANIRPEMSIAKMKTVR